MQEENPPDKKVTLLHTHYFRWTIHSDCLKSLSPAYFASTSLFCIPSLSLLYRRRSKIWSIQGFQHCSDRAVNRSGVLHHSTTHDSKVISSLPPLSPSKDLQPSGAMFNIIGTVCRAHWTPERGLQRAELEVLLQAALPADLIVPDIYICLENRFFTQLISQTIFCFCLLHILSIPDLEEHFYCLQWGLRWDLIVSKCNLFYPYGALLMFLLGWNKLCNNVSFSPAWFII